MDPSKTAYAGGQPQAYATASAPTYHMQNPQAAYAAQQQQMYQPQYQQAGQPVAAYPAPPPQIIIQQVEAPAPGLLDLRSAQQQNRDNANFERNPDGKEDIDQVGVQTVQALASPLLSLLPLSLIIPLPSTPGACCRVASGLFPSVPMCGAAEGGPLGWRGRAAQEDATLTVVKACADAERVALLFLPAIHR